MIKSKKTLTYAALIFIAAEAALAILLQVTPSRTSEIISYSAIVLAALFFIIFAENSVPFFCTQIALFCTACADYFLVYSVEIRQIPAMILFSIAQIAYFLRLYLEDSNHKRKKTHIIIRIALSVTTIIVTLIILGNKCDAVALISMFYYANLILNAIFAFLDFRNNKLFAIGLLLFILCDTVIGLSLIDTYIPLSPDSAIYKIIHPGFNLAWAFYVPSQTLIAISLLPKRLK